MPPDEPSAFTPGDLEILQELMNISFGTASAELAAAWGTNVVLHVPQVQVMPAVLFRYYVSAELKDQATAGVFEQDFVGDLRGTAFLVLPAAASTFLDALRQAGRPGAPAEPEDGVLVRAGSILVRACVEKLGQLLGTAVSCTRPTVNVSAARGNLRADLFDPSAATVILRTTFRLGQDAADGFLFLAVGRDSARWLQEAMQRFMSRYQ